MFLDAVHITNKFAQHGDTVLTKMVNLPETQVNVNVSALDVDSVTTIMSVKDSSFVDSVYGALSDSIQVLHKSLIQMADAMDSLSAQVTQIFNEGIGYPDWATDIVFPLAIAIFALMFPVIITITSQLNNKFRTSIYTKLCQQSVHYKGFKWALIIIAIASLIFCFIYKFEAKARTGVDVLLVIMTCILIVTTSCMLRHLLKVSSYDYLIKFLRTDVYSAFFVPGRYLKPLFYKKRLKESISKSEDFEIFEIILRHAIDGNDDNLLCQIYNELYIPMVSKIMESPTMNKITYRDVSYQVELLSSIERIQTRAYSTENCTIRTNLSSFSEAFFNQKTLPNDYIMFHLSKLVMTAQNDTNYLNKFLNACYHMWVYKVQLYYIGLKKDDVDPNIVMQIENWQQCKYWNFVLAANIETYGDLFIKKFKDVSTIKGFDEAYYFVPLTVEHLLTWYIAICHNIKEGKYNNFSNREKLLRNINKYTYHYAAVNNMDFNSIDPLKIHVFGIPQSQIKQIVLDFVQFNEIAKMDAEIPEIKDVDKYKNEIIDKIVIQRINDIKTIPISEVRISYLNRYISFLIHDGLQGVMRVCPSKTKNNKSCNEFIIDGEIGQIPRETLLNGYWSLGECIVKQMIGYYIARFRYEVFQHIGTAAISGNHYDCTYNNLKKCLIKEILHYHFKCAIIAYNVDEDILKQNKIIAKNGYLFKCPYERLQLSKAFPESWNNSLLVIDKRDMPVLFFANLDDESIMKNKLTCIDDGVKLYTSFKPSRKRKDGPQIDMRILLSTRVFVKDTINMTRIQLQNA